MNKISSMAMFENYFHRFYKFAFKNCRIDRYFIKIAYLAIIILYASLKKSDNFSISSK